MTKENLKMGKLKIILTILVLLVGMVLIVGCSGKEQYESKSESLSVPLRKLPQVSLPEQEESLFTGQLREIKLIAKRFEFAPNTITVNKGDKLKITLTSEDTTHGFAIPDYELNIVVPGGETVTFEFIADKQGTFSSACSVLCGSGHGNMKGTLIVE